MDAILEKKIQYFKRRWYIRLYGFTHKIKKKVVFESFFGKEYSCNPRAISEKMHELYPDYEIVWHIVNPEDKYNVFPSYARIVTTEKDFRKEIATSFCYVTNEQLECNIWKKKKQLFIQTWHGDRGFKKILYEAWKDGKRPFEVADQFFTDYFISGSDYSHNVRIPASFHYKGRYIVAGCPRNDKLVIKHDENKIKAILGIPNDVSILLYAPTFRKNALAYDCPLDFEQLKKHLPNGEWMFLVRAHPGGNRVNYNAKGSILDVSDYPDMADLLQISDVLLTDYSSSAGDFVLTEKPLVLLHFDTGEYNANERGFSYNPIDAGYIIAHNEDELFAIFDTYSLDRFRENSRNICNFYGIKETGKSSAVICEKIDEAYSERFGR